MKKLTTVAMFLLAIGFAAGCGSSSSSSTDPEISDLSELPKATSPMASASADISKDIAKANAATTGLNIRTTTSSSFNYLSSVGSCNTFNVVKQGVNSAAQADMILCFISNMNTKFAGMTDDAGNVIDIYDGNYHIFNMNIVGDTGAPNRVKMKITKTGGSITDFKMWMCKKTGDTYYQNEYTDQTIAGTAVTMTALGRFSGGEGSGWHHVAVSGTMDANRVYTTKTITTKNWSTAATDPQNWSETILTQTPGLFSFSGYNKGSSTEGGSYEDTSVGLGQMIGDTGALTALAMGDGSVKYTQSFTPAGETAHTQNGTNTWNGDTTQPEAPADNDYYTTASGYTYSTPAVQSSITTSWIAFSDTQAWDCTDDVGVGIYTMPETSYTEIAAACSEYTFDHNWINCYTQIGMCNGDNMCANNTGDQLTACQACFTNGMARKASTETETCLTTLCAGDAGCIANVNTACPAL